MIKNIVIFIVIFLLGSMVSSYLHEDYNNIQFDAMILVSVIFLYFISKKLKTLLNDTNKKT